MGDIFTWAQDNPEEAFGIGEVENYTEDCSDDYDPLTVDPEDERIDNIARNGGDDAHYDRGNKYLRELTDGTLIDVYDVLYAFGVTNPATAHAVKKMLCAGLRGYKDFEQDIDEAIESLTKAKKYPPTTF